MSRTTRVRRSRRARAHLRHLYRGRGTREREMAEFEERYGERGGRRHRGGGYVYGAVVGKVARERKAKRRAARRGRVRR